MATKKTTTPKAAAKTDVAVEQEVKVEAPKEETPKVEPVKEVPVQREPVAQEEPAVLKEPRKFAQNDPILCRSVTPGGLIVNGRSGQKYVFSNVGDEAEIEFQDLNSLKNSHSDFLYRPLLIIEDDELLENPRWTDLAKFYEEKVYGMDDINEILGLPNNQFKNMLEQMPKGLIKQLQLTVSQRIEDGTFDSLQKIKMIDDYCGTNFMKMLPH